MFSKPIVTENPLFTKNQIEDFFNLFNLYADRFRKADVKDLLNTAKSLGFDQKYRLVYDALLLMEEELNGEWITFETFLTMLTEKLVK